MRKPLTGPVAALVVLAIAGCGNSENGRLAEMAERNLERQAAQEARNAELQREVAEGTKLLVEADAMARKEIIGLHRDVQFERTEIGKQRDQLESDRREIAAARNRDPIVSESIKVVGLILACAVPLLIALQVLRRRDEPDEHTAMAEILLNDLTSETPQLFRIPDQSVVDVASETPR